MFKLTIYEGDSKPVERVVHLRQVNEIVREFNRARRAAHRPQCGRFNPWPARIRHHSQALVTASRPFHKPTAVLDRV